MKLTSTYQIYHPCPSQILLLQDGPSLQFHANTHPLSSRRLRYASKGAGIRE